MKVDGVLARDNVGDGRALGLARLLGGRRHCYKVSVLVDQYALDAHDSLGRKVLLKVVASCRLSSRDTGTRG